MDTAKQGTGWTLLDLGCDPEIQGEFSPLPTQHLGSWHRLQLPWAVTRDGVAMASLEPDLEQESIHQPQEEIHFTILLILQATQKTLPKVP